MYIKLNCHQKNCLAHNSSDKQCRHTIMMNYFLKLSLSGLWLINYFSSLLLKLLWLIILNRQQYISFFPLLFVSIILLFTLTVSSTADHAISPKPTPQFSTIHHHRIGLSLCFVHSGLKYTFAAMF